jgi:hypothetical protein
VTLPLVLLPGAGGHTVTLAVGLGPNSAAQAPAVAAAGKAPQDLAPAGGAAAGAAPSPSAAQLAAQARAAQEAALLVTAAAQVAARQPQSPPLPSLPADMERVRPRVG